MDHGKWELIVDNRFKYNGTDPQWHRVSIESAKNWPLNDQSKQKDCLLSARYKVYMPFILDYDVRSDDIWIITYPRSGNIGLSIFAVKNYSIFHRHYVDTGNGLVN